MPTPEPTPAPAAAHPSIDAERARVMLMRLAELGMMLAENLVAKTLADPDSTLADATPTEPAAKPPARPPAGAEFDRIARSVRRNLMLAKQFGQPQPPPRTNPTALPRAVSRRLLQRDVEEAIEECAAPEDRAGYREDLYERLDRPEIDEEIEHRPLPQVMTDIRRDMGFEDKPGEPPWIRRTAAEWAGLCDRSTRPTSTQPAPNPPTPNPPAPNPPAPNPPTPGQTAPPNPATHLSPLRFRGKPHPA